MNKPYIKLSDDVYKALFSLKKFNYENIYNHSLTKKEQSYYREGMNKLFDRYLDDVKNNNKKSIIFTVFLNNQVSDYLDNTDDKRKVIDFIAGMTDEMLIKEIAK